MPHWQGLRTIRIVTACMTREGTPTFACNEVNVTHDDAENGIHYYLAEAQLMIDGFEEPYVHFDEDESPGFLHPAVLSMQRSRDVEAVAIPF